MIEIEIVNMREKKIAHCDNCIRIDRDFLYLYPHNIGKTEGYYMQCKGGKISNMKSGSYVRTGELFFLESEEVSFYA